ncbi:MAG: sigma-70 family RNA polymerase sigma factor [Bryobacteraceae bacterium]|jgi:RNA polymerase sigma-70 factor (ECF subfamily)
MPASEPAGASRADLEWAWSALIRRIAAADESALAALYDATNHLVYGMALRILGNTADAEAVTLDIYTQVWRGAAGFRDPDGSAIAWLTTITRNRAIDRLRSGAGVRPVTPLPETDAPVAGAAKALSGAAREVRAALASLPAEEREPIELAYWYGYSHAELAARLGQPSGAVKTRIRTGMMRLRSQLEALS